MQTYNIISYEIYPIYSVNIKEGNYQVDELINNIKSTINSLNIKKYDYYSKIFSDNINYSTNLEFDTKIDKHEFTINYNETNNIIEKETKCLRINVLDTNINPIL